MRLLNPHTTACSWTLWSIRRQNAHIDSLRRAAPIAPMSPSRTAVSDKDPSCPWNPAASVRSHCYSPRAKRRHQWRLSSSVIPPSAWAFAWTDELSTIITRCSQRVCKSNSFKMLQLAMLGVIT